MKIDELYQEIILDHYKAKHHSGLRKPYDAEVYHVNPVCGDEVRLRIFLDGDLVSDVSYESAGCSISQASTSVMTDLVIGRTTSEGLALYEEFLAVMQGRGEMVPDEERLEDAVAFAGVARFPARVKCALLGWSAFRDAASRAISGESRKPEVEVQ